jgi:hypothetical protein
VQLYKVIWADATKLGNFVCEFRSCFRIFHSLVCGSSCVGSSAILKFEQPTFADGKKLEHSLFLEVVSPDRTEYWVFVLLPYESAQAWCDARRAFHGRKAKEYYGKTRRELKRALNQGLNINNAGTFHL